MSIAIGLIGDKCAIVASDSRDVDGVKVDDNFDKTFYLLDEKVIAAQVGLLKIGKTRVIDIIEDIVSSTAPHKLLKGLVDSLCMGLEAYLNVNLIDSPDKNIRVLMIGRTNITSGSLKLWAIDIEETEHQSGVFKSRAQLQTYSRTGDAKAVAAIDKYKLPPAVDRFKIQSLSDQADKIIHLAIDSSGTFDAPHDDIKTCGGSLKIKCIDLILV